MPYQAENRELIKKATSINDLELFYGDLKRLKYVLIGVAVASFVLGFLFVLILKYTLGLMIFTCIMFYLIGLLFGAWFFY